ncbi:ABC transporter permease [Saccharolobus islandicus]|uniref:Binding-protein-dependent transport systems inner membrane component n=3 Tax=Saccharolobus islandicus TaxID=43080 RepID=C4KKQ0_SACI6|nr:ABC transporter permease [Sulfolobus islandicus]ACP39042.1 binding-protein-dependent transport systems inner membrane component [Sulfolobus islandicus M.14.25]ACP56247.1 binding-protein-dependent transport systems inner membrane component [Sulfolobus islandicus M.16.27]ACR42912.1 binding-protein-dependent transport systems inner membrane component [Sulfolobus islandicus M.16.4]
MASRKLFTFNLKIDKYGPVYNLIRGVWEQRVSRVGFYILLGIIVFSLIGIFYTPYNPSATNFPRDLPPSPQHLLGTDDYGHDIFSQLLVGGFPVIGVGFAVGLIGTLIAILIGITAGLYAETMIDRVLSAITQIFLIIPGILIIELIGAYLGAVQFKLGYITILFALSLTGWAWGARVLRSLVLSLRRREYILSSDLIGESKLSIIFNQIIPNNLPFIASNFFFTAIYGIAGFTFIYYFGLGSLTQVNWGTMLYWSLGGEAYLRGLWWWYIPPGLMIGLVAFSFALINIGIDRVANPRLRIWDVKKYMKKIEKAKEKEEVLTR